ncbi:DUF3194 domain-containing protein [Methanobacterium alkalithermotolerans]|uniref:DUF3194 domain-containing protein n=1 Tax=Methanobacterium alkalithermotolerans TaxID=2731220 RepID=A0A8T8K4D7_9EURY|nr:DUF3194 domain-containing protein [Methanobacterium alkalithermotolerans]QUH22742.1 DUF3194 domain-containing protein [Methanobacterium alkalithermotolerans]
MPGKLKKLSPEDLNEISDFLSSTAQDFILNQISSKEIDDLDIKSEVSYNQELDVDLSIDLQVDELCVYDEDIVNQALDFTFKALESFLDDNYRE